MDVDDAVATARRLVAEHFPEARAAWLAGSVVAGTATASSDLDVTVLLAGEPAPYRESLRYDGWPVELFVHTPATIGWWLGKDRARRRPSLARLVAGGVRVLDVDGAAEGPEAECRAFLEAGPGPATEEELAAARYALSDLLDDLADAPDPELRTASAVAVWQAAAELRLLSAGGWWGSGKWLVRELRACDARDGTSYAARLDSGLRAALSGDRTWLTAAATAVLDGAGGRLWEGHRAGGEVRADGAPRDGRPAGG
ncbi:nucleotidyltransferase domain-containing protein [Nocardioides taihuensis]|uniref:Nucleotidyltransferase domain-containing protein n=1 Tax=Nocardioides taihuensis TaxID=1835606 RepID=A0ABW0BLC5_9ACTN